MSGTISGNGPNTFGYTGAVVQATVSTAGNYYIAVSGAQGGAGGFTASGGKGAVVGGEATLTAGELLNIVVGGAGGYGGVDGGDNSGGGGGGSFVYVSTSDPLAVAGGGGGGDAYKSNGGPGQTSTAGQVGYSTDDGFGDANTGGAGGTNGSGGGGGTDTDGSNGGGGAGFLGNGGNGATGYGGQSGSGGSGPTSFAGGAGGAVAGLSGPAYLGGTGGFGGGGGGAAGGGGSGGGGYSGGGGGSGAEGGGGGGGSFLAAGFLDTMVTAGANSGNGSVLIAPIDTPTIAGTVANQLLSSTATIDPFASIVISDPNLGTLPETVTVTPSATANGALSDQNAATDHSSISNGVYTVIGTAAQVQADLQTLVFTPATNQPGQPVTTGFTVSVTNIAAQTVTDSTTSVIATAPAQPIGLSATPVGAETVAHGSALSPFSGVAITDPNAGQNETATITLSNPAAGTLALRNNYAGGLSLSSSTPGTYVLTATSPANEAAALDALLFQTGSSGTTAISLSVQDTAGQTAMLSTGQLTIDPGPSVTDTTTTGEKVAHGTTVSVGTVTPGLSGDMLTLTQLSGPAGALTLNNGTVSFAVPAAASGAVSFSYQVKDQLGDVSTTASDTLVADPGPTLSSTPPAKVGHGQTATIGTATAGLSGDTLSLSVTTPPKYGTLALNNGVVTYTAATSVPAGGETDSFAYAVKDQLGDVSTTASPSIALDPGPVAGTAKTSVNFGTTTNISSAILAAVTQGLPGDTETITAIGSSSPNGTETLSNGQVSFAATGGTLQHIPANGSTTVSFGDTITDQLGETSNGTVTVTVNNPADNIFGSTSGNATIQGTAGADVITAYAYNNTINDNGGNDLVNAGAGQATVNTSSGDVIVRLNGQNNTVSGSDGYDTVSGSQGNTKVTLGNGNDTITLGGTGNAVTLGNGTDSVTGSAGNTAVTVGSGNDTLQAGGNNNTIAIGTGTDTVTLNGYGNTVTGGGAADIVSGSTGSTTIKLGNGVDTVSAGGSNNTITTGSSADTITLTGSSNLIDAGSGTNMLFLGGNTQESLVLHLAGDDVIAGFNVSGNDVLRLGTLLSEAHVNLNGSLSQLGTYLHATSSGGNTSLTFDASGAFAGKQVEVASLTGITTTFANLQSHGVFSLS